ncbi:hypothetical protein M3Y94_01000100 [Aphelenchoides besseyi]|nr:hypothetical protein M3Y94_01000100 [Aphelenchoides besseyi]
MLTDEAFQKLLFDLFCLWHDVQRHYDPPISHTEEEKMFKVKKMICKLLGEIDARVKRIRAMPPADEQEFIEEWTMLTWNVMCITSRLQNSLQIAITSSEDRVIFNKLNMSLIELVNHSRSTDVPLSLQLPSDTLSQLTLKLTECLDHLHKLYRLLKEAPPMTSEQITEFDYKLHYFANQMLIPFIDFFKAFCNDQSVALWNDVRAAQIQRMIDYRPMPHAPVNRLVSFYSYMMHKLAVLAARLQGFRFELTTNKVFGERDPVQALSDNVFSALELLMSDCVLATEPSTNPILVTNNLFSINCGALARGVVFKQFEVQVVTEEAAEHIQSEMRRQKNASAAITNWFRAFGSVIGSVFTNHLPIKSTLLAMKPTSGTKRSNSTTTNTSGDTQSSSSHKKSDVNSKEMVNIYPVFNAKNRYWAATYPQLLCTTRQKGRQSTNNSFQDLSPNAIMDPRSSGKRPIFYFHICATMFSPSGKFANAHTLSLPITIATRRNQDCQVQRMMSSYTATVFWLFGTNVQDGLLLQWCETGMSWDKFKELFKQHFRVNAEVQRGLHDRDFDLLQYKLQCNDCVSSGSDSRVNNLARHITFKNMLCPHLRYECGSTNVRFSVWRGMLELQQLFTDQKTNVRKLWEKNLVLGFLEFDQVAAILAQHESALIMRLSFVTGGTICFTLKSNAHSLHENSMSMMHLEPLDLKKLQAKCLSDYLRDIAVAEKVKYIINGNFEPILITDVLDELNDNTGVMEDIETSRQISSNVTHSGDIDKLQHITFTAMRIAVVTCKVKPPSADVVNDLTNSINQQIKSCVAVAPLSNGHINGQQQVLPTNSYTHESMRLPSNATPDDFARELVQLCNFHGKSRQELLELLDHVPNNLFCVPSPTFAQLGHQQSIQYSPPLVPNHIQQSIAQMTSYPSNGTSTYSHMSSPSPSPMNTSPIGSSTTLLSQPPSVGMTTTLLNGQVSMESSPPNTFMMSYGQL